MYRLVIVERLCLIAILIFGLVSLTTSYMGSKSFSSKDNSDLLAIEGLDYSFEPNYGDNVDVPVAGGKEGDLAEDENGTSGDNESAKSEEEANKSEEELGDKSSANEMIGEYASVSEQMSGHYQRAVQTRYNGGSNGAQNNSRNQSGEPIDYNKVVYIDDNGEAIDDNRDNPFDNGVNKRGDSGGNNGGSNSGNNGGQSNHGSQDGQNGQDGQHSQDSQDVQKNQDTQKNQNS